MVNVEDSSPSIRDAVGKGIQDNLKDDSFQVMSEEHTKLMEGRALFQVIDGMMWEQV